MGIYEDFFKDNHSFEVELKEFGDKWSIPVERILRRKNDREDFLATISEFHFGLLFGGIATTLHYDKQVSPDFPKTPDWTIYAGDDLLIAEVFRLNESADDKQELDFADSLMDELQLISESCYLTLDYDYNYITDLNLDVKQIGQVVRSWLPGKSVGEQIKLSGVIDITVVKINTAIEHVCVISPFSPIKFKYSRLSGERSRLFSKFQRYSEVVEKFNLPFLICIDLTFHSWFDPDDLSKSLYGTTAELVDGSPFNEFYPNAPYRILDDAIFYANPEFKSIVSGVIVRFQGMFNFFPNFSHSNKLPQSLRDYLDSHLYKEFK